MSKLTITRAATVLSLTQLAGEDADGYELPLELCKGFLSSPEAAVAAVGPASLLPLYRFPAADGFAAKRVRSFGDLGAAVPDVDGGAPRGGGSSDEEYGPASSSGDSSAAAVVPQRSALDALLLAEWEDRAERGLFRYDVTACPTRVLDGAYGFVAQLNEGRASKKRPTEFRVDRVAQPWDAAKFNFTKALQKEVLLQFAPAPPGAGGRAFAPAAPPHAASPNLVFINVSPIEYGHVLLVPRVLDALPQLVDAAGAALALQFCREARNPHLRLGFNSLGAYGTVNHLHFQAYYLAAPFAIERAPTAALPPPRGAAPPGGGVRLERLAAYPVRAMVLTAGDSLGGLAAALGGACARLAAANVPHNFLVADCGARAFLWPNAFAERKARGEVAADLLDTAVDPAVFEVSGHMVLKRAQDYAAASQDWAWRLLEHVSYDEARFLEAVAIAFPA